MRVVAQRNPVRFPEIDYQLYADALPHSELGYNYRMTDINAAIGRVQACEARGLQPPPAGERRVLQ